MKKAGSSASDHTSHSDHAVYIDRVVAQVCRAVGWQSISPEALSNLTHLTQDFISNIGNLAISNARYANRGSASFYDVHTALIESGVNMTTIRELIIPRRLTSLSYLPPDKPPICLKISHPRPRPSYVPEYLLPFPQPHTYIRTPTYKMPVCQYTELRDARAKQKVDVLTSLSKHLTNTRTSFQLIPGREDCTWVEPGVVNYKDWLILSEDDMKGVKKKKSERVSARANPYLIPPKSSWDGLFLS